MGTYKLKSLTPNTLQEFLNNKKLNGYTKNGISNFYGVLSGALRLAVHPYELIKENPMTYVSIPKFNTKKAGEACDLTWDNIDFENKTLTVEKSLLKRGLIWEFDTPKTDSSNRTIKIGDSLINILKHHQKWQKENQLRYGQYYAKTEYNFHGKL